MRFRVFGAILIVVAGGVSAAQAAGARGGCPCNGDVNEDGEVNIGDVATLIVCAAGEEPPPGGMTCDLADVNCDGVVDMCDASRVYCLFMGGADCCGTGTVCGACCSYQGSYEPCEFVSADFCTVLVNGEYLGDGIACDPMPCTCSSDAECGDDNPCTEDVCGPGGVCENTAVANGTPCPDGQFCDGDESCVAGACAPGEPRNCDDNDACTADSCDEEGDACVHGPPECDHDGVCDAPCETAQNCPDDCLGCPCDGDLNGDGVVIITDVLAAYACAVGDEPPAGYTCDNADFNCDGVVDTCDASRVLCQFEGGMDCCGAGTVCGACCNESAFGPCAFVSWRFCYLFAQGQYLGDGIACDPMPCECFSDQDCSDGNPCTEDVCGPGSVCEYTDVPEGAPCADGEFCNGDEVCQAGICVAGVPRDCNDGLPCTVDSCSEAENVCVHAPIECNHNGVCDAPCESSQTCPDDCGDCPCDGDVNEDGVINILDVVTVFDCAMGDEPPPEVTCDRADVNCDGVVDTCDASRVFCMFEGNTDCCGMDTVCGACCNDNASFAPCALMSEVVCTAIAYGVYLGGGTECDPMPCECVSDADCDDGNPCTEDMCGPGSVCEYTNVPEGTPCADGEFCNGDEACQAGICVAGVPRDCDDGLPCTDDTCDEVTDECVHTPIECNHNGVCDAPCETVLNCPDDCGVTCSATRDLSDPDLSYCPPNSKTIHIVLDVPPGTLAVGVEDTPPVDWTQISNISDGGTYDAVNHKVKWGPLLAPFPAELTYDVVPPNSAQGVECFTGTISVDGVNEAICGDECLDSCCPYLPADEATPACAGCGDCTCATCGDGRVEMCEMVGYACAWHMGCNDDLAGMTRAAFIWVGGECYCWDETAQNWFPASCPAAGSACCDGGGRASNATTLGGVAKSRQPAARISFAASDAGFGALRPLRVSITVRAPKGTSAMALDCRIPTGWKVTTISDGGAWDGQTRKVKWGPFFEGLSRTVTFEVRAAVNATRPKGFSGTVSFDGVNHPIVGE